jgi:hypothetical protein
MWILIPDFISLFLMVFYNEPYYLFPIIAEIV